MPLNMSNYDAVLKEAYEGGIRETINNDVPMFKVLDQSDREWSGRLVRWPVHTARNSGVGSRAEGATLPTAGQQGHQESRVSASYHYGRFQVSGPTIRAGKNAFAQAIAMEMDGVTKDLVNDLSRQTWGDGTGRLAQVGCATASSTSIFVFNRFFEPGQPGARYIGAGQLLDGGTVASPRAQFSSITVVSVNTSQNPATTVDTVTVSASTITVTPSDNFLFNAEAGGSGLELFGIRALVDGFTESNIWGSNAYFGSAIQNINRATVSQWNALILANSGVARVIDGNLLQTAFDRIHTESGKNVGMIMGHHDVVRAVLDSVSADRRYSSPEYNAGMSGLTYNGVPIERDRHAPYNELLLMVKDALKQYTLLDVSFADDDGAILSRVSNQDAFEGFIRTYRQMGIDTSPKETLMIRDIRVDL